MCNSKLWAVMLICTLLLPGNVYGHLDSIQNSRESLTFPVRSDIPIGSPLIPDSTKTINRETSGCAPLEKFKPVQLILPASLIAVGIFGVYNHDFLTVNNDIKENMDSWRKDRYFHIDDYIQYLPALTYLTFGAIKIPCKHDFKERVAIEATAYIVMAALCNIGKYSFKEKRPDSNARNSFPSGHTATVFTGAELMRIEYGTALGMASYAVATGVALLRLYNGRHWFNDVIAGAGLGILSARIGYWMLPVYRKWFKWNKKSNRPPAVFVPTYSPEDKVLSLNIQYHF